jgi:hypothetical protein
MRVISPHWWLADDFRFVNITANTTSLRLYFVASRRVIVPAQTTSKHDAMSKAGA